MRHSLVGAVCLFGFLGLATPNESYPHTSYGSGANPSCLRSLVDPAFSAATASSWIPVSYAIQVLVIFLCDPRRSFAVVDSEPKGALKRRLYPSILSMASFSVSSASGIPVTLDPLSVRAKMSSLSIRSRFHFLQPAMSCCNPTRSLSK